MITVVYAVLFGWAAWCIWSDRVNDGVVGRTLYSAIAIAAFAAFFAAHQQTYLAANQMIITAVALIGLRHFIMKIYNDHFRGPRP